MVIGLVVLAVVVGGGAVLLAQGGDDRSEEELAYVDALADFTQAEQADGLDFDAEESRCFAEAIVDALGVDALREAATPEEIRTSDEDDPLDEVEVSRSQAEAVYDDSNGCVEYRQIFLNGARQDGASDAQMECLDGAITDELMWNYIVATFDEGDQAIDDADRAVSEATAPCESAGRSRQRN